MHSLGEPRQADEATRQSVGEAGVSPCVFVLQPEAVDSQRSFLAVQHWVEVCSQFVPAEYKQSMVAPAPLGRRSVDLPDLRSLARLGGSSARKSAESLVQPSRISYGRIEIGWVVESNVGDQAAPCECNLNSDG